MKRLSKERKIQLERLRERRERKRERRIHGRIGSPLPVVHHRGDSAIGVPPALNLDDNFDETMELIDEMRTRTLKYRENVFLDFGGCHSIDPAAGIVLTAEVQRSRFYGSPKVPRVNGNYPQDTKLEQFLSDLGFFQQIKVASRLDSSADSSRAQYIQIRSGISDQGEAIARLAEMVFSGVVTLDRLAAKYVYRALSEAMSNVSRHAYDPEIKRDLPVLRGRWWMAGRWDRDAREIMALFFDQGVGIPATLPKTFPEQFGKVLAKLGLGSTDGPMIRAAMEIGRTRTGESHRGKGLNDLRRIIDFAQAGRLTIMSGKGRYTYSGPLAETEHDRARSIGGTLIEWRISGSELVTWKDEDESN